VACSLTSFTPLLKCHLIKEDISTCQIPAENRWHTQIQILQGDEEGVGRHYRIVPDTQAVNSGSAEKAVTIKRPDGEDSCYSIQETKRASWKG
jgi:hypothetical protein